MHPYGEAAAVPIEETQKLKRIMASLVGKPAAKRYSRKATG
jgi:hypothetical protein